MPIVLAKVSEFTVEREYIYIYIHGRPQPSHPAIFVGPGVGPDVHVGSFEFSTGSIVDGTVVG